MSRIVVPILCMALCTTALADTVWLRSGQATNALERPNVKVEKIENGVVHFRSETSDRVTERPMEEVVRISIEGEVAKPRKFTMDEILTLAPLEERIYRHRCVEAWSIVVPWIGFSFNSLIKLVEPTSKAQFVAFQSYYDSQQMPLGRWAGIEFPYVEGLRLDEAMNPLTLLCVGMYGESLPNQDGAPVRMVIPWKYGFKSIKSLVKIKFQQKMPPTTWNLSVPNWYGFYSNVNPNVDHPRWSQAKERRLGEIFKRPTLMFNGYGDQVASIYNGMDLKKNY